MALPRYPSISSTRYLLLVALASLLPGTALQAQSSAVWSIPESAAAAVIPPQTPLAVALADHIPLKAGQPIRAELLYPVYAGETELLPRRTVVEGSIVALTPSRSQRRRAMLRGDFTPFRTPVVRFNSVVLADGRRVPISVGEVTGGAPVVTIAPPPPATWV